MALKVLIRSGDLKAPASIVFDAPRIVIGRGEGSEVRLPDPSVSHRHASIRQRGTDYVLIDEGSTNGTFAGGVRLSPQAPRVVRSGDLVRVGRVWLEIQVEQAAPTVNPQATTREIALALVQGALAAQGERVAARVIVKTGPDQGKELVLADFERVYVVGRAPEADLCLVDNDASRRHVELMRRGEHVCVRDLGSKNGSELGGLALVAKRETPWNPALTLHFGDTSLALEDPLALALRELEASADEAMRPEELVEPPAASASAAAPSAPEQRARVGRDAPLADLPERTSRPVPASRGGLRTADIAVAVLALVVLGLSLLGLAWVLRAN